MDLLCRVIRPTARASYIPFLPLKMAAASAYFRLFSIYVMSTNDVIVNARSQEIQCITVTGIYAVPFAFKITVTRMLS